MRIGLDARNDGTGVGRYTFSLVRELAAIDKENEYVLFLRHGRYEAYVPPAPNFRAVEADIPWFTLREQLLLPRLLAREHLDLVHYPNVTVPLLATTPFVVTIHDLNYLDPASVFDRPSLRSRLLTAAYRLELQKVRRARRVIAVSGHTRDALPAALRVDLERIAVTYEAAELSTREEDQAVLERNGLARGSYFLYVGSAYPYKNLLGLIDAFALHADKIADDSRLVLAGDHEQFASELRQRAKEHRIEERVVFPGVVSEAELAALYNAALAYVFVSLREGFGLPGLEAMAAGVPVIAARAGSLPEVYRDAAEYCDPLDIESIATALASVAGDEGLRTRLSSRGRERAAEFSWRRTAEQTLAVYRDALSLPPA
jgi:glycosyltransferase involved in cell wall biosynthesis